MTVTDRQSVGVDSDAIVAAVVRAAGGEGAVGEISIALVEPEEMQALNREHMGQDGPTDVLSFPVDGLVTSESEVPVMVGDIVICPAYASAQADDLAAEMLLLAVHGTLHLLGFDHDTEANAARMREREIRSAGRAGAQA